MNDIKLIRKKSFLRNIFLSPVFATIAILVIGGLLVTAWRFVLAENQPEIDPFLQLTNRTAEIFKQIKVNSQSWEELNQANIDLKFNMTGNQENMEKLNYENQMLRWEWDQIYKELNNMPLWK